MTHPRGILDTSTYLLRANIDAEKFPHEPLITAMTLAELSVGPLVAPANEEAARRQLQLQEAETLFEPIPFDAAAARSFGAVSASLRRAGRKTTARTFDALIAATAIACDLPLYTCNPADFEGIDGLTLVAVPHPG